MRTRIMIALIAGLLPTFAGAARNELPLIFEVNRGQAMKAARFVARANGYTALLTQSGALLLSGEGCALYMKLVGAEPAARMEGTNPHPGTSNYLRGQDPRQWIRGIPIYRGVRYRGIYPGIDAVFYGTDGRLEYDFVVAPGVDPGLIRLEFDGAENIRIDASGDLVIPTPFGELRQHKPVIYQERGGRQEPIDGRYALRGRQVGFEVQSYDKSRPLVIDPVLSFVTYFGNDFDYWFGRLSIAVDNNGDAYLTGTSVNTATLQTTAGAFMSAHPGGYTDVVVAKLNADGTQILYCTYLGGQGDDRANAIAIDPEGYAYITGATDSADFPTKTAYQSRISSPPNGEDAFVTKLNQNGSDVVYSTFLGGTNNDAGNAIAIGDSFIRRRGRRYFAHVTGHTDSSDFPVTPGALKTISSARINSLDTWVTKLHYSGVSLVYSTYLGGSDGDSSTGIAVNSNGNAYVTGGTSSRDFVPRPNPDANQTLLKGSLDGFVVKLNPSGSDYDFSTYLGGSSRDAPMGIALEGDDAYVTGWTASTDFPVTAGAFQTLHGDRGTLWDAFVTKLDGSKGSFLHYSTLLGHDRADFAVSIAVDKMGHAYVAGYTNSKHFPTTPDALRTENSSDEDKVAGRLYDGFLSVLEADGEKLFYSTLLGGRDGDFGEGVALGPSMSSYTIGSTWSDDLSTTAGSVQPIKEPEFNAFVVRIFH